MSSYGVTLTISSTRKPGLATSYPKPQIQGKIIKLNLQSSKFQKYTVFSPSHGVEEPF
jgi:hypothetical protein